MQFAEKQYRKITQRGYRMADKISVSITNISLYRSIVTKHYQLYQELAKELDRLSSETDPTNAEVKEQALYRLQCEMDCEAAIICIFSHMTFEAFCNVYLLQHMPKKEIEDKSFIEKVDSSIVQLLAESGNPIPKEDAPLYYGADIKVLVNIRNKMVHRYPVRGDISLKTDESLQRESLDIVRQIKECYLRRIDRAKVYNAATAYDAFIASMKASGVDFTKLSFNYE